VDYITADIPKERLDAFVVTGIDFCGPFLYKSEVRYRFYMASNDLYALEEGRGRFGLIMQPTLLALAMSCSN